MTKHEKDYRRFKESIKDLSKWIDIDTQPYIERFRSVQLHIDQIDLELKSINERRESLLREMYNMKLQPLRDIKLDVYEFVRYKSNKKQILDFLFTEGYISSRQMEEALNKLWNNRDTKYNNIRKISELKETTVTIKEAW